MAAKEIIIKDMRYYLKFYDMLDLKMQVDNRIREMQVERGVKKVLLFGDCKTLKEYYDRKKEIED